MGKRQIGEMQPFELVITLIVADLACLPMTDSSIPLVYGVISLLGIFIIHQLLIFLSNNSTNMEKVICGNPTMLIEKNKICIENLKKMNITPSDMLENIRTNGFCGFHSIDYAIIETNGKMSFLPIENASKNSFALIVVNSGTIDKKHLCEQHFTEEQLFRFLSSKNLKLENIFVLTVDREHNIYYQEQNEN